MDTSMIFHKLFHKNRRVGECEQKVQKSAFISSSIDLSQVITKPGFCFRQGLNRRF